MKKMSEKGIEAWNARSDEVIKCGSPVSAERREEILANFTPIDKDEIEEILREYKA